MVRSRRNPPKRKQMKPRVKVWLESDGQYVFGFGISEILKAIQETGSIKGAAGLLGKSYRHVWARVKESEEALGESLVDARVGGKGVNRSFLTELGVQLVSDYDALRQRMFEVVEQEFSTRFVAAPDRKAPRSR